MAVYTCTTVDSILTTDVKAELAAEISRIHSTAHDVPSVHVNVVFSELPFDSVYTDGAPICPLVITGWIQIGQPDGEHPRLGTEIALAASRITGIPIKRIFVVFESIPAHYTVAAETR